MNKDDLFDLFYNKVETLLSLYPDNYDFNLSSVVVGLKFNDRNSKRGDLPSRQRSQDMEGKDSKVSISKDGLGVSDVLQKGGINGCAPSFSSVPFGCGKVLQVSPTVFVFCRKDALCYDCFAKYNFERLKL